MNALLGRKRLARTCAAAVFCTSLAAPLYADDLYLRLANITGEGTTDPYAGWTSLGSAGFGIKAETSWTKGGGASVGRPNPGNLVWNQAVDTTVPLLLHKITTGTSVALAEIQYVRNTPGGKATFMQLVLKDLFFTDLGFNGSAFSAAAVYRTIGLGYRPLDTNGQLGTQLNTGWDVPGGKVDRTLSTAFSGALPTAHKPPSASPSAERAYLRLDSVGAGESRAKGYENWIELSGAAWNVTAESSWTKGGGASVGKPQPGHLTWSQTMDKGVLSMFEDIVAGTHVPSVTLEFVKDGPAGPVTYMQLAMKDFFYTGLEFADADVAGDGVFRALTQTVWQVLPDGTRGQSVSLTWDIPSGIASLTGAPAAAVAGFGPGSLAPTAPVPEPESYALMLAGLALIGAMVRRKRGTALMRNDGDD